MNVEIYSQHYDLDLEELSFTDLGNLAQTSNTEVMLDAVEKVVSEVVSTGEVAAILGGEHSITYGCLKALPADVDIVIFDAHFDLRDEFANLRMSHATHLRRYIEQMGCDHIIHVGARAGSKQEWKFADKVRLAGISGETISSGGSAQMLLRESLKDINEVYISLDLDVLDPAFAPGVGNPEAGGLAMDVLLKFLREFEGKRIVGFDIVELSPAYDTGVTAVVASKCLSELLALSYIGMR